ncbi:MAG: sugar phosphate nucleotidyltransferase [candidate division KSB1 bacterium]|nr:sugar phosphate nucleotidyltransferase [candidate division KSB1 bacterium]
MYAVIMAGGSGTRFWPRSREAWPKQLLNLVNDRSMLQNTVARMTALVPLENVYVVATRLHADAIREQLRDLPPANLLIEPKGKNTAPCIGLAALHVRRRDPEGVMVVLPADHLIQDEQEFTRLIRRGVELAVRHDALVTLGIQPVYPSTGYGYIQFREPVDGDQEAFWVRTFAEKPTLEVAKRFLESGDFLWNSGIFIWKASTILREIGEYLPELYEGLLEIEAKVGTPEEEETVHRVYCQVRSISIDYGVMEKAQRVIVLKATFGWNDLGSWEEIYKISRKDPDGNAISGEVLALDTRGCLIDSPYRLIATLGLEDLVIVDAGDALLICRRDRAQDVRDLVEMLKRRGLNKYV